MRWALFFYYPFKRYGMVQQRQHPDIRDPYGFFTIVIVATSSAIITTAANTKFRDDYYLHTMQQSTTK
jgi:hypothetical protein